MWVWNRKRETKMSKSLLFYCGHRTWEINFPTLGYPTKKRKISNWWLKVDGEEYMSAYVFDTLCLVGVAGGVFRFLDSTHMDESYGFKTMGPSLYSPLLLLSLGSLLLFFIIPCLLLVSCFLFFNCLPNLFVNFCWGIYVLNIKCLWLLSLFL